MSLDTSHGYSFNTNQDGCLSEILVFQIFLKLWNFITNPDVIMSLYYVYEFNSLDNQVTSLQANKFLIIWRSSSQFILQIQASRGMV